MRISPIDNVQQGCMIGAFHRAIGLLFDAGVTLTAICLGFVAYMIAAAAVTFARPNPRAARLRPSEG